MSFSAVSYTHLDMHLFIRHELEAVITNYPDKALEIRRKYEQHFLH